MFDYIYYCLFVLYKVKIGGLGANGMGGRYFSSYLKKDHIAVPERMEELYTLFCNNYATFCGYHLCLRTVCKLKRTVLLEVLQKACGVLLKYAKMQ